MLARFGQIRLEIQIESRKEEVIIANSFKNMKTLFTISLVLLGINLFAQNYVYLDGSGNKYELIGDTLEYNPVKKENSSSGEYSGGEYKKVKVTSEQKKQLKAVFEKAIKAKEEQQENREMMTGMVIREKKKKKKEVILKSNSIAKAELEKLLKEVLYK